MANKFEKQQSPEELVSGIALKTDGNIQPGSEPGTSYEVFRNNTTAVEVIVKEVPKRGIKRQEEAYHEDYKVKCLQRDVEVLRHELIEADSSIERMRKGFGRVIFEVKKQLDVANQREAEVHAKNVVLQLENEKLTTLLQSKTGLVVKLKRELQNMRRTIKFVLKSVCYAPKIPDNISCSTEGEYNDFENSLKRGIRLKLVNLFDGVGTGNSTISRDV